MTTLSEAFAVIRRLENRWGRSAKCKYSDNDTECCLHSLPNRDRVCCWCGAIFLPVNDLWPHGKFKPAGGAT